MKYQITVLYGQNETHTYESTSDTAGGLQAEMSRQRQRIVANHGLEIRQAERIEWVLLSDIRRVMVEPAPALKEVSKKTTPVKHKVS